MGNTLSTLYYSCKNKKNILPKKVYTNPDSKKTNQIKVSPSRTIRPKLNIDDNIKKKTHRKNISDELDDILEKYRRTHPQTLIVDSPKYGLDKREVLKKFGIN